MAARKTKTPIRNLLKKKAVKKRPAKQAPANTGFAKKAMSNKAPPKGGELKKPRDFVRERLPPVPRESGEEEGADEGGGRRGHP